MTAAQGLALFFRFLLEALPALFKEFEEKYPELRDSPPLPPAGESDADAARGAINDRFDYED